MDWDTIKSYGCKEVSGTKHDLSHLKDVKHHFTIEASGKYPEISFSILVQYSSHCVTWGPKHGQEIDFTVHSENRRIIDDKGVHRCFCETRHRLSFNLPAIFETLTERLCLFTGHENWLTIEILDPSGKRLEYEVKVAGFSLHAGVAAEAWERQKLERLCRYISRPAVCEKRLSLTASGNIRYDVNGITSVAGAWMRRSDPTQNAKGALPPQPDLLPATRAPPALDWFA
jgi:hypothetical protein